MRILIIGAGDIGFQLTKQLSQEKHDLTIIDNDPHKVKRAKEQLDAIVIEGNGSSQRILEQANIEQTDVIAAMTNREELNLLACRMAKKKGVPATIARVRNPEFSSSDFMLSPEELGIDLMINPEKEAADAVVRLIRQSCATDLIEFAEGKIQIMGVRLERSALLHIPLTQLGKEYNNPPMRVVAIKRKQQTLIPKGDDELASGDQVFIISDPEYVPEFLKHAGKIDCRIEDVMILGGGLIGQLVAQSLDKGINAKIIESNSDKSLAIADVLPRTLIICGDGTDMDLLATEGILDMDAFISVTGDDETNIIATLVARHLRVPRTIALVNKTEYLPLTHPIGMDAVVSKQLLTANAIEKFIQRQQVSSIATLPGLDGSFIEFEAKEGSKIVKKNLNDLRFPEHAIICAVHHDDQLVIPRGDTLVQPGDKVIVFTLPRVLDDVEKLFSK